MPTPGSTATGGPSAAALCPISIPPPPRVLIIRTESAELSSAVAAAAVDEYKHNCATVHTCKEAAAWQHAIANAKNANCEKLKHPIRSAYAAYRYPGLALARSLARSLNRPRPSVHPSAHVISAVELSMQSMLDHNVATEGDQSNDIRSSNCRSTLRSGVNFGLCALMLISRHKGVGSLV